MMDKFEEKLFNLKIPEISDKFLEYELKEKLEKKLFYNKFKLPYHIAFTSALAMFILAISFVVNPDIASKINYVFAGKDKSQIAQAQKVEAVNNQDDIQAESFYGFEGLAKIEKQTDNLAAATVQETTDTKGEIKTIKYLNPDDFEEGKIYMIRKYKGQDQEGIIMINEIENNNNNRGVIRKM